MEFERCLGPEFVEFAEGLLRLGRVADQGGECGRDLLEVGGASDCFRVNTRRGSPAGHRRADGCIWVNARRGGRAKR
jgi:hypothetical protein